MSHTRECLDANRFGDGFDCICSQDSLRKALARIEELEMQLATQKGNYERLAMKAELAETELARHKVRLLGLRGQGGTFESFLEEEGIKEEVDRRAEAKIADGLKACDEAEATIELGELLADATIEITPGDRAWARQVLGTEKTAACNAHVPHPENPLRCAKCGKPL